ncbi:hypothetical protein JCM10908_000148 [Rhodotorula pacifica]|uniref:uncharacterized protein n=1 Tax=Rhodotorula pacifica TaxID=1495444 RepID=UPI00317D21F2
MPRPRRSTPVACALALTLTASAVLANPITALEKRASPTWEGGYYNPTSNGGQWLTDARDTYPPGLGEPINLVISAESDGVLMFDEGFFDYSQSLQFSGECLGQTGGLRQAANLGDGNGMHNQSTLLRENFGDPAFGTCLETFNGGYHYRVWRQNGTQANSGAWFLAASKEYNLSMQHDITPNGYDVGRDEVVRRAIVSGGTKSPITNRTFETTVRNASGPGYYANISTSQINHGVATDGIVAILTVKVTGNGSAPTLTVASSASQGFQLPWRITTAYGTAIGSFAIFALALLA